MNANIFRKLLKSYADRQAEASATSLVDDWYEALGDESIPALSRTERKRLRNEIYRAIHKQLPAQPSIILSMALPLKVAASLLLFACSALLIRYYATRQQPVALETFTYIATPANGMKRLQLPDSTVIWLNGSSTVLGATALLSLVYSRTITLLTASPRILSRC